MEYEFVLLTITYFLCANCLEKNCWIELIWNQLELAWVIKGLFLFNHGLEIEPWLWKNSVVKDTSTRVHMHTLAGDQFTRWRWWELLVVLPKNLSELILTYLNLLFLVKISYNKFKQIDAKIIIFRSRLKTWFLFRSILLCMITSRNESLCA